MGVTVRQNKNGKGKWFNLTFERCVSIITLVVLLLGTGINYFKIITVAPEYSLVTENGRILLNRGFKQYGLSVEEKNLPIINSFTGDNTNVPSYILKFNKVPTYFEITTQEGAIPNIKQIDINKYEVQFTFIGYRTERGVEINRCNFKIQAY